MAWTAPKTWTAEPLTSSDMNTYIRDNQNYLKALHDNNTDYIANEVSNYTTTSTTFADVDGTNYALTITTTGQDVMVFWCGTVKHTTHCHLNIAVDGTDYFSDDGVTMIYNNGTFGQSVTIAVLIEGLSAGSHTFKLRWKVNSGTATIYAGDGTANLDPHPQFWVQEV